MTKTVAIGSANPVKVGAVKTALKKLWPKARFVGIEVDSGVKKQPMSDEETLRGARNRAKAALKKVGADMGVGLEGGVMDTKEGMMNVVWCCIVDRRGKVSEAGGIHFMIPESWSKRLKTGKEISDVLEEVTGDRDMHKKGGMIGWLTKNLSSRQEQYVALVKLAMIKLVSPELYS